ncbi:hypothetical protein BDV12DRAFT_181796 [Aspergillus spectabilis]
MQATQKPVTPRERALITKKAQEDALARLPQTRSSLFFIYDPTLLSQMTFTGDITSTLAPGRV